MRVLTLLIILVMNNTLSGQAPNYFGSGNIGNLKVYASSALQDNAWSEAADPINTINGSGLHAPYFEAARFLMQASIGFEEVHVENVMTLGVESWIDNQISLTPSLMLPKVTDIFATRRQDYIDNGGDPSAFRPRPFTFDFNYAWWDINMKNNDLLRQKVAVALSEIFVISRIREPLSELAYGIASYYDVLVQGAFGNFRDLIGNITFHPVMGIYLTYINNPKTDTIGGIPIRPDENYARELMQLFTIGLFEMNVDGSKKLNNGQEIPTYGQEDIQTLAKVFTGLSYSKSFNDQEPLHFGMAPFPGDHTYPMMVFEDQHEQGQKVFLNNKVIPNGQTGEEDINDALDILFNHPNVAPFICKQLIQRLIKSNPSKAYISRIATIFNNNGQGVRGDLAAVIKAIYMDEEARDCSYQMDDQNGRLKEPLFRYTHFARMIAKTPEDADYWNANFEFNYRVRQDILSSPSVFNFFLPDDAPNGPISDAGLVAPEYSLHDERTSIQLINRFSYWTEFGRLFDPLDGLYEVVFWDKEVYDRMVDDTEYYLNWLDKNLCHGSMTDRTRRIIRNALESYNRDNSNQSLDNHRIINGMFLALIAPEYNVMR